MKQGELRAKGLLSAHLAELSGLSRAFKDRTRLLQSYKVTQIVIELKKGKMSQTNDPGAQATLEADVTELSEQLLGKEREILQLNERILAEIADNYEVQWSETLNQVAIGFANNKIEYH